jgi:flavin reductase (DIM6/NTAB) family NADH-FMN oxidoreductase RutF
MDLLQATADTEEFVWMVKNSVVPRPIAWVSTVDPDGRGNLAPYSYFNLISMYPPVLGVAFIGAENHSYLNVIATGEFVVNMVSDGLAEVMNSTAAKVARDVDEAVLMGLEMAPSNVVAPPRVARASVSLECRYRTEIAVENANFVIADVVAIHVEDRVLGEDGRVQISKYKPVGRLGGSLYTTVRDEYKIVVPAATDEWMSQQPGAADLAFG